MTRRHTVTAAIGVAILLGIGIYVRNTASHPQGQGAVSDSQGISEKDKELLLKAIRDPFATHVRKAIDNFNAGKSDGISSNVDLRKYNEYLQSKFVLMQINNAATMGGKDMVIAFTEKPDKLFYVWVYRQSDGSYELRAFEPQEGYSAEQAKSTYESSRPLIEELNLAM